MKNILNITNESFNKYGYVIEHDDSLDAGFQVILRENDSVGWRIAVSRVKNKGFQKLGKHPDSMESFEPVRGVALICVALADSPEEYEVFLLDKPVCLLKNIWHATASLSENAIIKITENLCVGSDAYIFTAEQNVVVG